jgi:HEPN domain-containing protein
MNETVKIWTDLSMSDLNSSRLLHNSGHYRTSYFFFQQATEKANKAFALFAGLLSDKEFKDIQHDQLKIYRRTIVKWESEIKTLIQVLKPYPKVANHKILSKTNFTEYQKTLSEGVSFIDSLRNYDLVNIPTRDLNYLIRQLKKIREVKFRIPRDFETIFKTQMLGVADWIEQFETQEAIEAKAKFQKFINNKEQAKQLYDLITNQILPFVIDIVFVNFTLYLCAIITIQHSSLTRYPNNNINPETIYTKRLPLVKKQTEFMDLLEEAISKLNRINAI